MEDFKSLPELLDYFKEDSVCKKHLEQIRWNGSPVCPHCGSTKTPYRTNIGFKCSEKLCYKKFTVKVGTIFEQSHIPLRLWFAAIWLGTSHKKGVASLQLHRDLGIPQKTAWFLLHRIREILKENNPLILGNTVEADETFIGGKEKNKHKHKKRKKLDLTVSEKRKLKKLNLIKSDKMIVFGMVERDGNIIAKLIPNVDKDTIVPIIEQHVVKDSNIMTDGWTAYGELSANYKHKTVNHKLKIFVNGEAHTNTIESFWSLLKRGLIGVYHYMSEKHLDRYLTEFCARYNTRQITEGQRFDLVLKNCENKRLTYKRLVS